MLRNSSTHAPATAGATRPGSVRRIPIANPSTSASTNANPATDSVVSNPLTSMSKYVPRPSGVWSQ